MRCMDREQGQRSIQLVTPLLPVSCSSDGRCATSSQVVSRDGAIAPGHTVLTVGEAKSFVTSAKRTGEAIPTEPAHRMDGGHGDGGLAQ
jgi:hypothetical protein